MGKSKSHPCQHPTTARRMQGIVEYCQKCGKTVSIPEQSTGEVPDEVGST